MSKKTVCLLVVGEANINGNIYTQEMADSIIRSVEERGYWYGKKGSLSEEDFGSGIVINDITHKVNKVWMEGKKVMAEVESESTPKGKEFEKEMDDYKFKAEGTGNIDSSTNKMYNFKLVAINAIKKEKTK